MKIVGNFGGKVEKWFRYLGLVRSYAHHEGFRATLLIECTARIVKNMIRKRMRNLVKKYSYPLEEHYKDELVHVMNIITGNGYI